MNKPLFLPPRFVEKEIPTITVLDLEAEAALARLEETYGLNKKVSAGRHPRKNFYRKHQHST